MQTFLPYSDYRKSLSCLDDKRLGKQRVEAMQMVNAIDRGYGAWYNHPCTQMWSDYREHLKLYHNIAIELWIDRGMINTMPLYKLTSKKLVKPHWLGNEKFHSSHRSNLLNKDYSFYSKYKWVEPDNLPYYWNGFALWEQ